MDGAKVFEDKWNVGVGTRTAWRYDFFGVESTSFPSEAEASEALQERIRSMFWSHGDWTDPKGTVRIRAMDIRPGHVLLGRFEDRVEVRATVAGTRVLATGEVEVDTDQGALLFYPSRIRHRHALGGHANKMRAR